jgi:hypothetical protein
MKLITGRTPVLPPPPIHKYADLWSWLRDNDPNNDPTKERPWVAIDPLEIGLPDTPPKAKVSLLRHAAERNQLRIEVALDDGLLFARLQTAEAVAKLAARAKPKAKASAPAVTPLPSRTATPAPPRQW